MKERVAQGGLTQSGVEAAGELTHSQAYPAYYAKQVDATKAALRSDDEMRGLHNLGEGDVDIPVARMVVRSLVAARAKAREDPECHKLEERVGRIPELLATKYRAQAALYTLKNMRGDAVLAESVILDRTPALDDRAGILAVIAASREPVPDIMEFRAAQK